MLSASPGDSVAVWPDSVTRLIAEQHWSVPPEERLWPLFRQTICFLCSLSLSHSLWSMATKEKEWPAELQTPKNILAWICWGARDPSLPWEVVAVSELSSMLPRRRCFCSQTGNFFPLKTRGGLDGSRCCFRSSFPGFDDQHASQCQQHSETSAGLQCWHSTCTVSQCPPSLAFCRGAAGPSSPPAHSCTAGKGDAVRSVLNPRADPCTASLF